MNRLVVPFALACVASLGGTAVRADDLRDPTRPPAALRPAPAVTNAAMTAAAPVFVLQSVLTGEGRKPTAIINARVVEVGETIDGHRLVRLSGNSALLAGPNGSTTLALTPASEKVATTPATQHPLLALTKPTGRGDAWASPSRTGETK